jgi:branched-chain amino acid transport system permease protein
LAVDVCALNGAADVSLLILAQVTAGGLVMGGLYALVAIGLSLVYGVTRMLNFAHGTFVVLAGIAGSILFVSYKLSPIVSIPLVAAVFFLFGLGYYKVLLRPIQKLNHLEATIGTVLVTIGTFIIVEDLAAMAVGTTQRNILLPSSPIALTGGIVTTLQLYVLLGIAASTVSLHVFLKYSWLGRAMRALTQDQFSATVYGVQTELIRGMTFAFGLGMAAIGGILYAMSFPVDLHAGFLLTVRPSRSSPSAESEICPEP